MSPKYDNSVPEGYECPIAQEPMQNPVVMADGFSYEKEAIDQWLVVFKGSATWRSPMTNQTFSDKTTKPNQTLKSIIATWCDQHRIEPVAAPAAEINVVPESQSVNYGVSREAMRSAPWFLALAEIEKTLKKPGRVTEHMQKESTKALNEFSGDEDEAVSTLWRYFVHGGSVQNPQTFWRIVVKGDLPALQLLYYIYEQRSSNHHLYERAEAVFEFIAQHKRKAMLDFIFITPVYLESDRKNLVLRRYEALYPERYLDIKTKFNEPPILSDLEFVFQEACCHTALAHFLQHVKEALNPNLVLIFVLQMKCGEALTVFKAHFGALRLELAQAHSLLAEDEKHCEAHALEFFQRVIKASDFVSEAAKEALVKQAVESLDHARLALLITHFAPLPGVDVLLVQRGLQAAQRLVEAYQASPVIVPDPYVARAYAGDDLSKGMAFCLACFGGCTMLLPFFSMGMVFFLVPYFVNNNDCYTKTTDLLCEPESRDTPFDTFNVTCDGLFRTCHFDPSVHDGSFIFTNEWTVGDTEVLRDMREVARVSTSRSGLILVCVFATAFILAITLGTYWCWLSEKKHPTDSEKERIKEREKEIALKTVELKEKQSVFIVAMSLLLSDEVMKIIRLLVNHEMFTLSSLDPWINYVYDYSQAEDFAGRESSQAIKLALYQTGIALNEPRIIEDYKPDSHVVDLPEAQAPQSTLSFWQRYSPFIKRDDLGARLLAT
jgi:hypothetical protein